MHDTTPTQSPPPTQPTADTQSPHTQSPDAFIRWLGEDFVSNPHDASGVPRPLRYLGMIAGCGMVAGMLGAAALWLAGGGGVRADYLGRLAESVVMAKQAIPLMIAGFALPLVLRLSLPEGRTGSTIVLLILACAVLPAMAGVHLFLTPMGEWMDLLGAPSRWQCMVFVPVLSLLLTAAQIISLRRWAVTRPLLTGAIIGVLSGATAAVIYALFCIEDAPAFYGFWYSMGIFASATIGAVAGGKWLRW